MQKFLKSPYLFVLVIISTIAYGVVVHLVFKSDQSDLNRGIFGDSFGALTALFSGLAFAGLVATLVMQNEQIDIARATLKEQEKQVNDTKVALDTERAHLRQQSFENRFFHLMALNENIATNLNSYTIQYGKGYFEWVFAQLQGRYHPPANDGPSLVSFFHDYEWQIGHYFRSVARIVNHILAYGDSAAFYVSIVSSSMSSDELRLLFYYIRYLQILSVQGKCSHSQAMELTALLEATKKYQLLDPIQRAGVNLIKDIDWETYKEMTKVL